MKYYFIAEYLDNDFHIPKIFSVEANTIEEAQSIVKKILCENYCLEEYPGDKFNNFIYDLDYYRNAFVSNLITENQIPDIQLYHDKYKSGEY